MDIPSEGSRAVPVFGTRILGREYQTRPGSYALILNSLMEIAVLQVKGEYFLPGGGIEPGELPEDALQREAVEECGWVLIIGSLVGEAVDYIEVMENGLYYEIQSRFYRAELLEKIGNAREIDHNLVWLPVQVAADKLKRQSQAWITSLFVP